MPELLPNGLPARASRSRFDFSQWADGQAWKFMRDEDYTSTTETFRYNVRRWAKSHRFEVKTCPLLKTDANGQEIAAAKAEPVGLAVMFVPAGADWPARAGSNGRSQGRVSRAA